MKRLYTFLYPELEDDRVCADIKDSACKYAPKSYAWNLISGMNSKLAEQLASPGVTLPWLLSSLGVSYSVIGLLQPIKEAGSMMPQLLVAAKIRGASLRKYFWAISALVQAAALFIMGLSLHLFPEPWIIPIILSSFVIYAMASGVASVAFSDVLGKTIPKGARGKLLGQRGSIGGLLTLGAALWLHFSFGSDTSTIVFSYLLFLAAILWAFASFSFAQIQESPGETSGGGNAIDELRNGLKLLKNDKHFRTFLLSRSLLLNITLSIPFYVLHSRELTQGGLGQVGGILFALSVAQILSSDIWGRLSDKSSKKVMFASAICASIAAILAFTLSRGHLASTATVYSYFLIFFILGLAQAGARIGRKTYLVDYAKSDLRARYTAVANTWMGLLSLLGISMGPLAQFLGLELFILLCLSLNMVAMLTSALMKDIPPS